MFANYIKQNNTQTITSKFSDT